MDNALSSKVLVGPLASAQACWLDLRSVKVHFRFKMGLLLRHLEIMLLHPLGVFGQALGLQ